MRTLALLLLPLALATPIEAKPLDDAARKRIDRAALRQPPETPAQQKIDLAGNVSVFLLDASGLPAIEERDRSAAFLEALGKRERLSAPPASTRRVFDKLLKQLPAHLKPAAFRYSLQVIDRKELVAFTPGGGNVVLSKPLLDALLADRERGESALAFVLARELGHVGLHHTRRGWQRAIFEEELKKATEKRTEPGLWRKTLDTTIAASGSLVQFLYTRDQHAEADLFAYQLCPLAGHDSDRALDGLRVLVALRHPGALQKDDYAPRASRIPAALGYYLDQSADPLCRLRVLLLERDGLMDEKTFGLFVYDRKTGEFARAEDRSLVEEDRPIVFVHGLRGGNDSFSDMLSYLGERKELWSRKLLFFRYPGNGSIARAGAFLANEVRRTTISPSSATFVCHSAGGLVFRHYAEKKAGEFDHAVLLGTPHGGSDLTALKCLVDGCEFGCDLNSLGLTRAIASALPEGKGQITHDLHPESLFLLGLGRDARLARRYHVIAGEFLSTSKSVAARVSFAACKKAIEKKGLPHLAEGAVRAHATRALAGLRLPEEVTRGDLIVTTRSASLPGAGRTTKVPQHHLALKSEAATMRLVLASVTAGQP